jgi:folate-dependent phosphoribosylglycinamide formyltransferase PurN
MHEKEMQVLLQRPVTILKDETLEQLRIKVEKEAEHGIQIDLFDLGGCGCFSEQ